MLNFTKVEYEENGTPIVGVHIFRVRTNDGKNLGQINIYDNMNKCFEPNKHVDEYSPNQLKQIVDFCNKIAIITKEVCVLSPE